MRALNLRSQDRSLPLREYELPRKYYLRALFRSASLVLLIIGYSTYNHLFDASQKNIAQYATESDVAVTLVQRQLREQQYQSDLNPFQFPNNIQRILNTTVEEEVTPAEATCNKAKSWWKLVLYIVGVLYLFLALAIVVDEFFVPALEEMSSERHMDLSMDVAGATLMAAGGSAPELFTSLFGTFAENDLGFGTIVGSAVFNVLFVIACVCLLSKEVLTLTWWPLFRDCSYYVVSLVVLAIFVGVVSPGEVYAWEAAILFVMYLGYVLVMKFNGQLYNMITKKSHNEILMEASKSQSVIYMTSKEMRISQQEMVDGNASVVSMHTVRSFNWPGTFRAGVLKMLRNPSSWVDTAGVGIVSKISGDVNATFESVDKDKDGSLSKEEVEKLFIELDCPISPNELNEVMVTLDEDKDGMVSKWEFTKWYIKSEERIRARLRNIFDMFDENNSGSIEKVELKNALAQLEPNITDNDVQAALKEMYQEGDAEEISFKEFSDWYKKSILYEKHVDTVDTAMEGIFVFLKPPCEDGVSAVITWFITLPLVFSLSITVPDVRRPGLDKYCYLSFILSIAWVGVYSYFMVEWATVIGTTIGIPDIVMGLTFLAAGTSVPDLLSSVIVARRGEGDMAVSSSIGSNIFDILIGLPFPWLCFTLWNNGKDFVTIAADGVWVSIIILLVMVVCIILTIHLNGWKLTKKVAYIMFVLYFAFLAQGIVQELPFDPVCS